MLRRTIKGQLQPGTEFSQGAERHQYNRWRRGILTSSRPTAIGSIAITSLRKADIHRELAQLPDEVEFRVDTRHPTGDIHVSSRTEPTEHGYRLLSACGYEFLKCVREDIMRSLDGADNLEAVLDSVWVSGTAGPYRPDDSSTAWHNDGLIYHGDMRYVTTLLGPPTVFTSDEFVAKDFDNSIERDGELLNSERLNSENWFEYPEGTIPRFLGNVVHHAPDGPENQPRLFMAASATLWRVG